VNTVALERPALPAEPSNGASAADHAGRGWIIIGPRVRAHLGPQLERALPLVWLALLEMSGAQEGQGYRLVVDAAHLEPASAPEAPPA